MSVDLKIKSIFKHYQNLGLCTHAYSSYLDLKAESILIEEEMSPDHAQIYDLASISKAMVTAPLVCSTFGIEGVENLCVGDVDIDGGRFPTAIETLALKDILAHVSGIPAWYNFYVCHIEQGPYTKHEQQHWILKRLNELCRYAPKDFKRGKDLYSDIGFIVLGLLLELKTKKSLTDLFNEFLSSLLEDEDDSKLFGDEMFFGTKPSHITLDKVVPTGWCFLRQRNLRAEVWDENAAALGGGAGHCGLFASGRALNRFLMLLLKSKVGRTWFDYQVNKGKSLGLRFGDDPSSQGFCKGKALGHMGFVGTALWLCPLNQSAAMLLTNRVISARINPLIKEMRKEVFSEFAKQNRYHRKRD